jgi:DNA-binding beta-propeller fold protein YncE
MPGRAAGRCARRVATAPGDSAGFLGGSVVDQLASQGSLAFDRGHGLLYAVNAGSGTITVFSVYGDRLDRRQVISSGGTFPVSVAFHGGLVYVLNARGGGSVQGFLRIGAALARIRSWNRPLGLGPALTPEFTRTPGRVAFTPDGSRLIVTTKGNGNDIGVFTAGLPGGLPAAPVVTADPGNVPFGITFDAGGHLVVAEAGDNAVATFTVNPDGRWHWPAGRRRGRGAATCWIARDGSLFYASDAGSGTLQPLRMTATSPGTADATSSADGQYLYAETGANGIVDEFRAGSGGSRTPIGPVTVRGAAGAEGIAAS